MDADRFAALKAEGFNRIPLVREALADLETPLSVYLKLANKPFTYLFESVQGGERFGRYSIVGLPCEWVLKAYGHRITIEQNGQVTESHEAVADPLAFVEAFQARFRAAPMEPELRFVGGLVGYFGYDVVRYIEPKLAQTENPDSLNLPDILLMLSDALAVVDNVRGKLYLIVYADADTTDGFARAQHRLDSLVKQLKAPLTVPPVEAQAPAGEAVSEMGRDDYLAAAERAKRYIVDGDIMQVQISQRIRAPFTAPPLQLYRALRSLNPSPYMFYLDLGDFHVVGASPEILIRLERDTVTLRPIAGTRPRGKTAEEDFALEMELLNDPKERAEHLMLIDLGRNDVGRVAQTGSVKVTEQMVVERYSHVMHIVSNVEGTLLPGISPMALLRATFPAGTVTGTPKVRAMEIIDELETVKRGVYAGAVGYIGFNGNMDVAIAIRTAVVKDGTLYAQAAAGIVADSIPENEWLETCNKARAVLRAAENVQHGMLRA